MTFPSELVDVNSQNQLVLRSDETLTRFSIRPEAHVVCMMLESRWGGVGEKE